MATAILYAALLQLAAAMAAAAHLAPDDTQCSGVGEHGWRVNVTHASAACNMPVLDASVYAEPDELRPLVERLAAATAPLLIRGLLDLPGWQAQAGALGNRSALLQEFGDEQMQLSAGALLSNGPESTQLDEKKLRFMAEEWVGAVGGALGDSVGRQVRAGEPRPRVGLRQWLGAIRAGATPRDSYVFQNVSGGPVARALAPLHELWRGVASELRTERGAPALIRLGVGGSGSGAPFHDHEVVALNMAFAGRKRWLIARPCAPNCKIPFYAGGAAVYHPQMLLDRAPAPAGFEPGAAAALRLVGEGGDSWDCVQYAGEAVLIPAGFVHATLNLDESVAVAVQCDDGADFRRGLSELNALIVHASGAAEALGPCGTPWDDRSPFSELSAAEALELLQRLPESFRGEGRVYLNRPARDGHTPVDLAVRLGSAAVGVAIAVHGASFSASHLADAESRGHVALAVLIRKALKS